MTCPTSRMGKSHIWHAVSVAKINDGHWHIREWWTGQGWTSFFYRGCQLFMTLKMTWVYHTGWRLCWVRFGLNLKWLYFSQTEFFFFLWCQSLDDWCTMCGHTLKIEGWACGTLFLDHVKKARVLRQGVKDW